MSQDSTHEKLWVDAIQNGGRLAIIMRFSATSLVARRVYVPSSCRYLTVALPQNSTPLEIKTAAPNIVKIWTCGFVYIRGDRLLEARMPRYSD